MILISVIATLLGLLVLIYSIRTLLSIRAGDPIAHLVLGSGSYEFDIDEPGYYSVAIDGAGHVRQKGQVIAKLTVGNTMEIDVPVINTISFRSRNDGRISTDYWEFSTETTGRGVLMLSNVEALEAKESMLSSKRRFEKPISHKDLRVRVYRSVRPIQRLAATIALTVGGALVVAGIATMFDPIAL